MTRVSASKNWFFTFNNYQKDDIDILENKFKEECKWYVFQEETGANGTKHLQGTIELKNKGRPIETFGYKEIHWEKTRKVSSAIDYCNKLDTRSGEIRTNIDLPRQPNILKYEQLYDWQKEIADICNTIPDDRTIYWFWEEKGCTGKTEMAKYIVHNYRAICVSGKADNCKFAVIQYEKTKSRYPDIIIWDVPRSNIDYISYQSIEELKNGLFFCGKYESCQVLMANPHIFVFANCPPVLSKLSEDRWKVVELA